MKLVSDPAISFGLQLGRCTTLTECGDLFKATIRPSGFDSFACGEVDLSHRDRSVIYILDWPEAWKKLYIASLLEHDPFMEELRYNDEPFTFSELLLAGKVDKVAQNASAMFSELGWNEVLAVPLKRGPERFGLVTLCGFTQNLTKEVRESLTLASILLYEKARRMVPKLGAHVYLADLTLREMDSLRLVAKGCSDQQIAKALDIAVSTAHGYVEGAKRKLKTKTRAEVSAIAVSLGLVEI